MLFLPQIKFRSALMLVTFLCAVLAAQDLPKIAVHITGDIPDNKRNTLNARLLTSLTASGRYKGIEQTDSLYSDFFDGLGMLNDTATDNIRISSLGRQFGVEYLCVANVTPEPENYKVSARIVDVQTAKITHIAEVVNPLQTINHLGQVSSEIADIMLNKRPKMTAPPPPPPPPAAAEISPKEASPKVETVSHYSEPKKSLFWLGIGLEAAGAGILTYAIIENSKIAKYVEDKYTTDQNKEKDFEKARKIATMRDIAYGVGAAALLSGISIHIFF